MRRRGRRYDWWSIPDRVRDWQEMSPGRKLVWIIKKSIVFTLVSGILLGVVTWYNTPEATAAFIDGEGSFRPLVQWWFASSEHLLLFGVIIAAVLLSILVPKRRRAHHSPYRQ